MQCKLSDNAGNKDWQSFGLKVKGKIKKKKKKNYKLLCFLGLISIIDNLNTKSVMKGKHL